jgi:hypothetical protein
MPLAVCLCPSLTSRRSQEHQLAAGVRTGVSRAVRKILPSVSCLRRRAATSRPRLGEVIAISSQRSAGVPELRSNDPRSYAPGVFF